VRLDLVLGVHSRGRLRLDGLGLDSLLGSLLVLDRHLALLESHPSPNWTRESPDIFHDDALEIPRIEGPTRPGETAPASPTADSEAERALSRDLEARRLTQPAF
jgi:hypothetical protein